MKSLCVIPDDIETTLNETLENLALIKRDDGKLANESVHVDALSPSVKVLVATGTGSTRLGDWAPSTVYPYKGVVFVEGQGTFIALSATVRGQFRGRLRSGGAGWRWIA